jgi:rare lipoprotein A (peptidoglycan hydrolase)
MHRSIPALVGGIVLALSSTAWAEELTPPASTPHKRTRLHKPSDDGHQSGNASFYAKRLSGRKTASGERYDPAALTAAHRTLPLGTQVKVVNPKNDKSVVVTVNDRGPVPANRMLDVSSAAADALGMKKAGVTRVETQVVGKKEVGHGEGPKADAGER